MKTAADIRDVAVLDLNNEQHLLCLAKIIQNKIPEHRRIPDEQVSVDKMRNAILLTLNE